MSRSRRLRAIALTLSFFVLLALPARAQAIQESPASIVTRVWQALLDALPALSASSSSAAGSTAPDPNPPGVDTDRGADIDPDGLAADTGHGTSLDPNG